MKKLFFFVRRQALLVVGAGLGLLGTGQAAQAQTSSVYDWNWATELGPSAGSNRTAFLHGLAADAAGNVTIGGEFDPNLYFANEATILTTNRQPDVFGYTGTNGFLAQYRPNGQLAWTLNLQSSGAQVVDVATDAAGNIYALGYRSTSLNFGSGVVLPTPTLARAFLVKLSAAGVPQWAIDVADAPYGVKEDYFIWQLAVDAAGNSVVQGTYSGSLTVAGQTYTAPASSPYTKQPFLVRVSAAGAVTSSWGGQQTQGDNISRFYTGLALAPTGEVYLSGSVTGATLQFGSLPLVTSAATATLPAGFLLKLSAANVAEWVLVGNAATATTYNSFNDVKVSASGHIYVVGAAVGPFTLGTQTIPTTNTSSSFVARIAPNGIIRRSAAGSSSPQNLALGPHEDLYLGTLYGSVNWGGVQLAAPASPNDQLVSVVRLDSTGQALQGWSATGPAIIREPRLAVDGLGQASVAAWLYGTGTFSFGSKQATAANPWGMFVARTGTQVLAGRSAQPVAGLELYPNPARQTATIKLASAAPAQAQVLDAVGRLASTQQLPSSGQLDLRGLAAGPYVVRVQQGEAVSYRHLAVLP